ncbi:MAG: ice-binding family protein [Candidatus Paceibacterota bacterium]|jgi:hypothetical protein
MINKIKKYNKNLIVMALALTFVVNFIAPSSAHAYASGATVNLGGAANFAILAKTAITTTGVTAITGNIGISPAAASTVTGFGPVMDPSGTFSTSSLINGNMYAADYTAPTPSTLTTAVNDMLTAYTDAAGRAADSTNFNAGNLGGQTLAPGVWKWTTDVTIPTDVTLSGTASDVWILQMTGNLTIASATSVLLSGGALASNVFWQVGGGTGATLASTSVFNGTILSAKQVIMQSGATLNGRALADTQVTLIGNTVGTPAATAGVLTWAADTIVSMSSPSLNLTILSGSKAQNLVVNAGTIVPTVVSGESFTVNNSSGGFTVSPSTRATVNCLAGGISQVAITGGSVSQTYTITPNTTACAVTGGGGGGGGGEYTPPVNPLDTTPPTGTSVSINAGVANTSSLSVNLSFTAIDATQMIVSNDAGFAGAYWENYMTSKSWMLTSGDGMKTVYAKFRDAAGNMSMAVSDSITALGTGTIALPSNEPVFGCSGGNMYNTSTGNLCVNNAGAQIPGCGNRTYGFSTVGGMSCAFNRVVSSTTGTTYDFGTVTLRNGSKGNAVMELQRFLNAKLSLGLAVDGKLGPKTIAVIKKWQKAHGLVADGLIGAKTKAKMNLEAQSN